MTPNNSNGVSPVTNGSNKAPPGGKTDNETTSVKASRIPPAAAALAASTHFRRTAATDKSGLSGSVTSSTPKRSAVSGNGGHLTGHLSTAHVCITPLRMLLKQTSEPKTFARINMLMDHMEERTEK